MTYQQLHTSQSAASRQGERGEQFVLEYERRRLPSELAERIMLLGSRQIAMGYDILSYAAADSVAYDRFIEVKTYSGHPHFYWTDNEISAAERLGNQYYIYLVDINRIDIPGYEPTIISSPKDIFYQPNRWNIQPQQYAISLVADENIPSDWDDSTILLGCYNSDEHLQWILSHALYNVREEKDFPGAISLQSDVVRRAAYLVLYSVANPRVYSLYRLAPSPRSMSKRDMLAAGYAHPHAFSYIVHPISGKIPSFFIDLTNLLKQLNHTSEQTYGTPLYLTGKQLRRYMTQVDHSAPVAIDDRVRRQIDWTNEQDAELIRMYHEHVDFNAMALHYNVSRMNIIHRLTQLGLIKPKRKNP